MTDARSVANSEADSSLSSGSEEIGRGKSKKSSTGKDSKKSNPRKLSANLLDSNGESEDEEINKLQKVIQDQTKQLNEEKQTSRKVKPVLFSLFSIVSTVSEYVKSSHLVHNVWVLFRCCSFSNIQHAVCKFVKLD